MNFFVNLCSKFIHFEIKFFSLSENPLFPAIVISSIVTMLVLFYLKENRLKSSHDRLSLKAIIFMILLLLP